MSSNIKVRGGHRSASTKIITDINSLLLCDPLDANEVRAKLAVLKGQLDKILHYDTLIQEKLDGEEFSSDMCDSIEIQTKIQRTIVGCEDALSKSPQSNYESRQNSARVHLPKLTLPTFGGNPVDWPHFWDSFNSAIHVRTDMSGVQKFNYLCAQLKGEASQLLDGFELTNENYEEAISLAKETYGKPHVIIKAHLHSIFDLKSPNATLPDLRKFRSSYECHVRALKTLGTKIIEGGFIISALLIRKLPSKVRDNLNRASKSKCMDLDEFREAMNEELEKIQANSPDDLNASIESKLKPNPIPCKPANSTASTFFATEKTDKPNSNSIKIIKCQFCLGSHYSSNCINFKYANERIEKVKELNLCQKCLSNKHNSFKCTSKFRCYYCKNAHNSALCFKTFSRPKTQPEISTTTTISSNKLNMSPVALPIAMLPIETTNGVREVKALFDQGSQRTFILNEFANKFSLSPSHAVELTIDGFNGNGIPKIYNIVNFKVRIDTIPMQATAIVVETLPQRINIPGLKDITNQLLQNGLKMANPNVDSDVISDVGILIGSDQYFNYINGMSNFNGINLLTSNLGYLINGPLPKFDVNNSVSADVVTVLKIGVDENDDLLMDDEMRQMWDLDSIGIKDDVLNKEEKITLREFENSITYKDNRYVTKLPWRTNHPPLPTNFKIAKSRLISILHKLRPDTTRLMQYDSIIKDQLSREFIEIVDPNEIPTNKLHYLAHHAVKKDSVTTPLRIVFDCSANAGPGKPSLNDCLYTGPCLTNELVQIMLRFRTKDYACVSDIAKAFLMIGLHEDDRDCTRFMWPEDPQNPHSKLIIFRYKVVIFGATCSQFLLNATILHHLNQFQSNSALDLKRNIYVDNIHGMFNSESCLIEFYHKAKTLLLSAGLTLREWATNSPKLKQIIDTNNDCSANSKYINVLGLGWDTNTDNLSFPNRDIKLINPSTKRNILRLTARVYDPLGLINPITIKSRIFIQKLWKIGISWDEPINEELEHEWSIINADLQRALTITLPRKIIKGKNRIKLHAFCDASISAYGVVLYLANDIDSSLVMSKCRVAPLKTKSIPRMELIAFTLGARLINYVIDAFKDEFVPSEIHLWTDSQVVLRWVDSSKPLEKFVSARVGEIKELVPTAIKHYVQSKENPSDMLSRGTSFKTFSNSNLWFKGPDWLTDTDRWPIYPFDQNHSPDQILNEDCCQISLGVNSNNVQQSDNDYEPNTLLVNNNEYVLPCAIDNDNIINFQRFNSYKGLLNTTMLVFKFVRLLKCTLLNNCNSKISVSDVSYLENAETWLVRRVQVEAYSDVIYSFENKSKFPLIVKQLNLYVYNNIIYCRGRIENSNLPNDCKNPMLIPSKHHFTDLVILDAHTQKHHRGINDVVSYLRQRWWFPKMRQRVKCILRNCVICKRFQGRSFPAPPEAPLPAARVQEARPFQVSGVDYTGALLVKNGKDLLKVYICLFTCSITRAVHLELVEDNSAESFLRAFRRFVGRRSCPRLIISDNSSTFTAAAKHIKSIQDHPAVEAWLCQHRCQWKFIPSRSPWFGGFWERLIGVTKMSLKKILGRSLVSVDDLRTLIVDVESGLNDRPLTYASSDLEDFEALTPSHLMFGFKLNTLPIPIDDPTDDELYLDRPLLTRMQKKCANILEKFWIRWRKEYLTALRTRQSPSRPNPSIVPNVGDVVLVHDDSPRLYWKLGLIIHLHLGIDGFVRSATLKTSTGEITRAIVHLYPLEISSNEIKSIKDKMDDLRINTASNRPKRIAAQSARMKFPSQL